LRETNQKVSLELGVETKRAFTRNFFFSGWKGQRPKREKGGGKFRALGQRKRVLIGFKGEKKIGFLFGKQGGKNFFI